VVILSPFKQKRIDIITGSILAIFSVVMFFIVPYQVGGGGSLGKLSALFPRMWLFLTLILSIVLIITRFIMKEKTISTNKKNETQKYPAGQIIFCYTLIIGYIFFIDLVGYYISTMVFLFVFMRSLGEKRWVRIFGISIIFTIIIYFLTKCVHIILPTGIFF